MPAQQVARACFARVATHAKWMPAEHQARGARHGAPLPQRKGARHYLEPHRRHAHG